MSAELIARAKAAIEGINDGPWLLHNERGHYGVTNITEPHAFGNIVFAQSDYAGYGNGSRKADAEFIATARTLVPELVAEVERLQAAPPDSATLRRSLAALIDHYFHAVGDDSTRALIENLAGLLRHLAACNAALSTEIEHYARAEMDALERAERAECRVDELAEEIAELRRQLPDYEVTR